MEYLTIALPKGKLFDRSVKVLAKVGCDADNVVEDSRKLVITNEKNKSPLHHCQDHGPSGLCRIWCS